MCNDQLLGIVNNHNEDASKREGMYAVLGDDSGLAMSCNVCSEELSGSSSMIRIKPSGY
jgi:hypothetical protein